MRNSWGLVRDSRGSLQSTLSAAGGWEPWGVVVVYATAFLSAVVVCRMATSTLSSSIGEPSVDHLEALRVEDLHATANHYGLTVPKQARKAELLASAREGLVEKGVLVKEDVNRHTPPLSPDRVFVDSAGATPRSAAAKLRMRLA